MNITGGNKYVDLIPSSESDNKNIVMHYCTYARITESTNNATCCYLPICLHSAQEAFAELIIMKVINEQISKHELYAAKKPAHMIRGVYLPKLYYSLPPIFSHCWSSTFPPTWLTPRTPWCFSFFSGMSVLTLALCARLSWLLVSF